MRTAKIKRLDIACAVRSVASFCKNLGLAHKKAALKVIQYMFRTKEWGITHVGRTVDSIWRRIRTWILELVWVLGARCRVQM